MFRFSLMTTGLQALGYVLQNSETKGAIGLTFLNRARSKRTARGTDDNANLAPCETPLITLKCLSSSQLHIPVIFLHAIAGLLQSPGNLMRNHH